MIAVATSPCLCLRVTDHAGTVTGWVRSAECPQHGGGRPNVLGLQVDVSAAIERLRQATGPGGRSWADVEAVCDEVSRLRVSEALLGRKVEDISGALVRRLAERDRLLAGIHSAITYLRASSGDGVIAGTAIEILEDARGGGGL